MAQRWTTKPLLSDPELADRLLAADISAAAGTRDRQLTLAGLLTLLLENMAEVAGSGDYNDLDSLPTLGTMAAEDAGDYTPTSGLAAVATSGDYDDLANAPALGNAAALNVGTAAGTVAAGDDSRLSDARTPTAHGSTHSTAGDDPITPADIGAAADAVVVKLTGAQTITGEKRFQSAPSMGPVSSQLEFEITTASAKLVKYSPSGEAFLDFSALSPDSSGRIRFHRQFSAPAGADARVEILRGDGTAFIQHRFSNEANQSYIARYGGFFGVGGVANPADALHNGGVTRSDGGYKVGANDVISSARHLRLRPYPMATLPSPTAYELIFITDEAGGPTPAFSDGTNWRRVLDLAIAS